MNNIIRLTKEFKFEMAHALPGYDGLCKHIHGHSYQLSVTIKGIIDNQSGPKQGMVYDFTDLKRIVQEEIIDRLDHALMLKKDSLKLLEGNQYDDLYAKIVWVSYQPTCENMLPDFANKLMQKLPTNVKLYALKLRETATSYAEWFAIDNPPSL